MAYSVAVRKIRAGTPAGDARALRSLRLRPDGRAGVVVEGLVRPVWFVEPREIGLRGCPLVFADLDDMGFPSDDCPYIDSSVEAERRLSGSQDLIEHDTPEPQLPPWLLAENAGGPYFVFNGDEALFEAAKIAIAGSGYRVHRGIRSKREAGDGIVYDWFLRLDRLPEPNEREARVRSWLEKGLRIALPPSDEETPAPSAGQKEDQRRPEEGLTSIEREDIKRQVPSLNGLIDDPKDYVVRLRNISKSSAAPSRALFMLFRESLYSAAEQLRVMKRETETKKDIGDRLQEQNDELALRLKVLSIEIEAEREKFNGRERLAKSLGRLLGEGDVRRVLTARIQELEEKLNAADTQADLKAEIAKKERQLAEKDRQLYDIIETAEGVQDLAEAEKQQALNDLSNAIMELEAARQAKASAVVELRAMSLDRGRLRLAWDLLKDFVLRDQKNVSVRGAGKAIVENLFVDGAIGKDAGAWKELVGSYLRSKHKVWLRDDTLSEICDLDRKDEVLWVLMNLRELGSGRLNSVDGWREILKPAGHIQIAHDGRNGRDLGRIYWRDMGHGRSLAVFHRKQDDREQKRFCRERLGRLNTLRNEAGGDNFFLEQIAGPLEMGFEKMAS